jgi:hypothetical protein
MRVDVGLIEHGSKLKRLESAIILTLGIYEDPTGPHISNDFLYENEGGKTVIKNEGPTIRM